MWKPHYINHLLCFFYCYPKLFMLIYLLSLLADFFSRVGEGVDEADDRKLVRRVAAAVGGELVRKFRLPRCAPLGIVLNNIVISTSLDMNFYLIELKFSITI